MSPAKLVSYLRVSTESQGRSGLGLEAQRAAVEQYAKSVGATIEKEFVEVESGKRNDRPQLAAALPYAKRSGATLCIAKLDRLARNAAFTLNLMESGVEFLCCDMPAANRLTISFMAVIAQHEREMISSRTKAALEAAKARGVLLGSARPGAWKGREDARLRGSAKGLKKAHKVIAERAREEYRDLLPTIQSMREHGLSLRDIAAELNKQGHRTRKNAEFTGMTIHNILKRG